MHGRTVVPCTGCQMHGPCDGCQRHVPCAGCQRHGPSIAGVLGGAGLVLAGSRRRRSRSAAVAVAALAALAALALALGVGDPLRLTFFLRAGEPREAHPGPPPCAVVHAARPDIVGVALDAVDVDGALALALPQLAGPGLDVAAPVDAGIVAHDDSGDGDPGDVDHKWRSVGAAGGDPDVREPSHGDHIARCGEA